MPKTLRTLYYEVCNDVITEDDLNDNPFYSQEEVNKLIDELFYEAEDRKCNIDWFNSWKIKRGLI
jgi:hypothetical protein